MKHGSRIKNADQSRTDYLLGIVKELKDHNGAVEHGDLSGYFNDETITADKTTIRFSIADYHFIIQSQLLCDDGFAMILRTFEDVKDQIRLDGENYRLIHIKNADILLNDNFHTFGVGGELLRKSFMEYPLLTNYCKLIADYIKTNERAWISAHNQPINSNEG